jgi:hypothetical protein
MENERKIVRPKKGFGRRAFIGGLAGSPVRISETAAPITQLGHFIESPVGRYLLNTLQNPQDSEQKKVTDTKTELPPELELKRKQLETRLEEKYHVAELIQKAQHTMPTDQELERLGAYQAEFTIEGQVFHGLEPYRGPNSEQHQAALQENFKQIIKEALEKKFNAHP